MHQHLQDKTKIPGHLTQISEKGATLLFAIPAHTLVTPATRDATVWPKMRRTVSMVTRITELWVNLTHRRRMEYFGGDEKMVTLEASKKAEPECHTTVQPPITER